MSERDDLADALPVVSHQMSQTSSQLSLPGSIFPSTAPAPPRSTTANILATQRVRPPPTTEPPLLGSSEASKDSKDSEEEDGECSRDIVGRLKNDLPSHRHSVAGVTLDANMAPKPPSSISFCSELTDVVEVKDPKRDTSSRPPTRSPSVVRLLIPSQSNVDKDSSPSRSGSFNPASSENGGSRRNRSSQKSFMGVDVENSFAQKIREHSIRSGNSDLTFTHSEEDLRRTATGTMQFIRLRIWIFLEEPWDTPQSITVHFVMVCVIIFSIFHRIQSLKEDLFDQDLGFSTRAPLDIAFNFIFLVDTLVRLVAYPLPARFLSDPKNAVDVVSLMPFLLVSIFEDVPKLREVSHWLWTFEVFLRVLRLSRFFSGWQLLFHAMITSAKALIIPMLFLILIVVFGSCSLYMFEMYHSLTERTYEDLNRHDRMEMGLTTIDTLYHAIHFSVICILSIGTGPFYDLQAASIGGKITVIGMMIFGMLFMAMPIAIVGACFSQTWFDQDRIVLLYKVRCRLQAQGFSPQDLYDVFEEVDEDGSGKVEFPEFKKMIETFHLPAMNIAKMRRLFAYFDHDGDGVINFIDFANTLYPDQHWDESSAWGSPDGSENNEYWKRAHSSEFQSECSIPDSEMPQPGSMNSSRRSSNKMLKSPLELGRINSEINARPPSEADLAARDRLTGPSGEASNSQEDSTATVTSHALTSNGTSNGTSKEMVASEDTSKSDLRNSLSAVYNLPSRLSTLSADVQDQSTEEQLSLAQQQVTEGTTNQHNQQAPQINITRQATQGRLSAGSLVGGMSSTSVCSVQENVEKEEHDSDSERSHQLKTQDNLFTIDHQRLSQKLKPPKLSGHSEYASEGSINSDAFRRLGSGYSMNTDLMNKIGSGAVEPLGVEALLRNLDKKLEARFDQLMNTFVRQTTVPGSSTLTPKPFNPPTLKDNNNFMSFKAFKDVVTKSVPHSTQHSRAGSRRQSKLRPRNSKVPQLRGSNNSGQANPKDTAEEYKLRLQRISAVSCVSEDGEHGI